MNNPLEPLYFVNLVDEIQKGKDGHVASVAVRDGDKILMGKRRDNNRWTLPGGHMEPGEKKHDGATRELAEEAGIIRDSKDLKHIGSERITTYDKKDKTIHAFEVAHDGSKTSVKDDPDKEVQKWQWVCTKDGLPDHVKENLHSPKNVVLQKLGLLKGDDDQPQGARVARKIARKLEEDPTLVQEHPEYAKYQGAEERMREEATATRKESNYSKPGIRRHQDDDEEAEKSLFFIDISKARTHKYTEKYKKGDHWVYVYPDDKDSSIKHHRYDEDAATAKLSQFGDELFHAQALNPTATDATGLNSHDMSRWQQAKMSGDADTMRKILKKYKRQHGNEEEYHLLGLSDHMADVSIRPRIHDRWKSLVFHPSGSTYAKREKFLAAIKRSGMARWDNDSKTWSIPKDRIREFVDGGHFANLIHDLAAIEIPVHPLPELPEEAVRAPTEVPSDSLSADEVIELIKNKQISGNHVAIRKMPDGAIEFYSTFSRTWNDIFSNKKGILSGIVETRSSDWARITYDLRLADEAIAKIKEMMPESKIVEQGLVEARHDRDRLDDELRQPIPHVQSKIAPGFALFPYQNEGVRFLEKTDGNALIGDEMGLGKTMQSLAWVAAHGKRVLVVVPKVVRRTWIQEAEKFFPSHFLGKSKELRANELRSGGMPDLTGVNIATINYESLEKFMPAIRAAGFDTIIVDESHRMKSPKAKITKTIQSLKESFKHKILLSGTAIKNKKSDLITQLEFIKTGASSLLSSFHGVTWNNLRQIYIARQKKTVLTDLPDKTTQITEVNVTGMPEMPSDIGGMSQARVTGAMAKAPVTVEFVNEILDSSDSSVLVFTESKEAAEKMATALGDVAILHHGQMSDDRREEAKAEFQKPDTKKRVFVSTRQSLAVGATLTAADKVVFNDLPWTAADLRQAEDRAHRIGQKSNVNVYWITAAGNDWDTNVANIIRKKYELNKKLNEGKQLTAVERDWMNKPVSLEEVRAQVSGRSAGPATAVASNPSDITAKSLFYVGADPVFYITDLFKSGGHKYIRKYMRGGKWQYVYHEAGKHGKALPEEALHRLKALAELGDEHAKKMLDSIEAHDETKLKKLRELADLGDDDAHGHLTSLGINRKAERLEEKIMPAAVSNKDDVDKEIPAAKRATAITAVVKHVEDSIRHLQQHADTPIARAIMPTLQDRDAERGLFKNLDKAKSTREVLDSMAGIAKLLEHAQGKATAQKPGEHVTYGNMIYNNALRDLRTQGLISSEYEELHKRKARQAETKHSGFAEVAEIAERKRREKEEQERRDLAEVHGSMAHYMSSIGGNLAPQETKELHKAIKQIFGKDLRKEDFPYNFESKGIKTKINSISVRGNDVTMRMQLYTADGKPMMESFERSWNKKDGRPHIHNNYMKTLDDVRDGIQIGNVINEQQRKLMKSLPDGGSVTVYADLDVGGYCWAQQGFSFESSEQLRSMKRDFKYFLQEHGVSISDAHLATFTDPVHFAQFGSTSEKKHIISTSGGDTLPLSATQKESKSLTGKAGEHPLTAQEIAEGKTSRMAVHLGKKFLLKNGGYKWNGVWDTAVQNDATKFADGYYQMRSRASELLSASYQAATKESLAGRSVSDEPVSTPRSAISGTPGGQAARVISYWQRRPGSNIVMSKSRISRVMRMSPADRDEFMRIAPITLAAKRRIRETIRSSSGT